jgi:hypothetical protein
MSGEEDTGLMQAYRVPSITENGRAMNQRKANQIFNVLSLNHRKSRM